MQVASFYRYLPRHWMDDLPPIPPEQSANSHNPQHSRLDQPAPAPRGSMPSSSEGADPWTKDQHSLPRRLTRRPLVLSRFWPGFIGLTVCMALLSHYWSELPVPQIAHATTIAVCLWPSAPDAPMHSTLRRRSPWQYYASRYRQEPYWNVKRFLLSLMRHSAPRSK